MTKLFQVDAFTDAPFAGNPAGVCLLDKPRKHVWMQAVAAEMNLSETAFLQQQSDGYALCWFTPKTEVALCGHATLASAWVLFKEMLISPTTVIHFHSRSGLLTARFQDGEVILDFPAFQKFKQIENAAVLAALGLTEGRVWEADTHWLVEVANAQVVKNLTPNFNKMLQLGDHEIIVTSLSDDAAYDFISRFFAPALGIDEDPVTGSAHCYLGPFWLERLGKNPLHAFQASARGGDLLVDVKRKRVELHGRAVTIFEANLRE